MNDYKVTRAVSAFGYYCGIALVILTGLGGMMSMGLKGLVGGIIIGAVLAIPFLMLCEGMHALVTIANNTKPQNQQNSQQRSHDSHAA